MPRYLLLLFFLMPIYWAYLLLNTQPFMVFDAIGYEESGRFILKHGLGAYFQTLNREPLFPYLVSRAMNLSQLFGVPYYYFLKAILFIFLTVTLVGIYRLARLLGVGRTVSGLGAFYAGVSPVILNSMLWLWSEGAALPWAVWGVFFFVKLWRSAVKCDFRRLVLFSVLSAFMFIVLLTVKAVAGVAGVLYGLPLLLVGVVYLIRREYYRAGAFVVSGVIFLGVFSSAVEGYKALNYKMNGNYELTTRFHWALYGNTVRRLQPLNYNRLMQAVLSVPRLGFCEKFYSQEACLFWSYQTSDAISEEANRYAIKQGFSDDKQRRFMTYGSFKLMAEHPMQQFLLSIVEGTKMFFWENRQCFVTYPAWMDKLYADAWPMFTYYLLWAGLSIAAMVYAFRRGSFDFVLTAVFMCCFIIAHSVFYIDIRYALPIAPLFIVLIAGMFQGSLKDRKVSV
ncbi:MAG: hypothetical protein HQL20_02345 [Candidatus Omnitrophica bacterium]|nr:hypothetical protein [Candidatus Omnitrophota bacterium]